MYKVWKMYGVWNGRNLAFNGMEDKYGMEWKILMVMEFLPKIFIPFHSIACPG